MKKRIILLLTFIVSFIMCTDIAKAANVQELTCVYDKVKSQPGIKLVQYKDEKIMEMQQQNYILRHLTLQVFP